MKMVEKHYYHDLIVKYSNDMEKSWDIIKNTITKNQKPGGRLNKKDGLTRYGDSHVKDKTS